jgi:hypothetical protein
MTEITKYLEALDEIIEWQKKKKDCLELTENIIVAIINQIGIDFRLRKDNPTKSELIKQEIIPATEGQIKALKLMNKFKEGLSKAEAWNIIHDSSNKKEQEY